MNQNTILFSLTDDKILTHELSIETNLRAGDQVCVSDSESETRACCEATNDTGNAQLGYVGGSGAEHRKWFCYKDVGTGDWD